MPIIRPATPPCTREDCPCGIRLPTTFYSQDRGAWFLTELAAFSRLRILERRNCISSSPGLPAVTTAIEVVSDRTLQQSEIRRITLEIDGGFFGWYGLEPGQDPWHLHDPLSLVALRLLQQFSLSAPRSQPPNSTPTPTP